MGLRADFCTWNPAFPEPAPLSTPPDGFFRIKLYWEEGYMWQNQTVESEWCMVTDFDGYPGDGYVTTTSHTPPYARARYNSRSDSSFDFASTAASAGMLMK
jgi:hypothetical protein